MLKRMFLSFLVVFVIGCGQQAPVGQSTTPSQQPAQRTGNRIDPVWCDGQKVLFRITKTIDGQPQIQSREYAKGEEIGQGEFTTPYVIEDIKGIGRDNGMGKITFHYEVTCVDRSGKSRPMVINVRPKPEPAPVPPPEEKK
ncbi:MAG: hypothetical protein WC980_03230 [Candidatus Brocadiia bacterium]